VRNHFAAMAYPSREDRPNLRNKISQHYPPSRYTVGWICAIPVELEAAIAMLDSTHERLKYQPHYDTNHYHLGSIGDHMVVITCLPLVGKVPAATTASYMHATFPYLRFRLMVGIGGAIPSAELDIRLGDIAVSKPSEKHGGVIEYDFGRWEVGGFRSIGSMNRPPTLLLNVIPTMISRRQLSKEVFLDICKTFKNQEEPDETWLYPGAENDVLFQADYSHIGDRESTCAACHGDKAKYVDRKSRPHEWPMIHYGTIASGDSVIKNTRIRDWLGEHENAICVEMEAAGLMNDFPSLVVRGISDYADSHKNSKWQPYASAAAAVYAKKLLQELGSSAVVGWNPFGREYSCSIYPYSPGSLLSSQKMGEQCCYFSYITDCGHGLMDADEA
jgi:nucleoside phosphorylase